MLNYFDELLDSEEFDSFFKMEVEKVEKLNDGPFCITTVNSGFRANNVIIAIGRMNKPNKPDYKIPPSIVQRVNFNLDKCGINEKVLIVGGGNAAAEYALSLCKTNIVTLCYTKPKFTRLNEINEKAIMHETRYGNIILRLDTDIKELVYDRVIYAIGGTSPIDFLKTCNIKLDEKGIPIVNENCATNINGLYVGGDLITRNGGSIVVAINHAHMIIKDILKK